MKVILLKDVKKVGKKFDTIEVSPGFARNFLFAQKLAEVATTKSIEKFELARSLSAEKQKAEEAKIAKELARIENTVITLQGKANEKGSLFAGIHAEELLPLVEKELGLKLAIEHIVMDKPIKELGEHEVKIRVQDKEATIKVVVEEA
jgi:large subunit ribosomal protein L9